MSFLQCRLKVPARLAAALVFGLATVLAAGVARAGAADAHIAPPADTSYAGTIALHVDATDTAQGTFAYAKRSRCKRAN